MLGMTMEQAASSFGWGELINFASHLPDSSAVARAKNRERSLYASDIQRAAMMADIYDAIAALSYMFACAHTQHGKPKKPKPYPRPWVSDDAQRIGSKPIPISEFDEWYYGGD